MTRQFRVLTWNCRQASLNSGLWDYLLELDPDLAILQDYRTVPERVLQVYTHIPNARVYMDRSSIRHFTGLLLKGAVEGDLPLSSPIPWVARELEHTSDLYMGKTVKLEKGICLNVVSVYNPATNIDVTRLADIDTTGVRLTLQRTKVWLIDLIWSSLASRGIGLDEAFILAGDFNSSETFDWWWGKKPRGNREIMDRFNGLGLYDALRAFRGELVPTFRNPRGGELAHQLDHLYVTPVLLSRLIHCEVGDAERIFGGGKTLSDHLPIIADIQGLASAAG